MPKVRATQAGFINGQFQDEGSEFYVEGRDAADWFEPVDGEESLIPKSKQVPGKPNPRSGSTKPPTEPLNQHPPTTGNLVDDKGRPAQIKI